MTNAHSQQTQGSWRNLVTLVVLGSLAAGLVYLAEEHFSRFVFRWGWFADCPIGCTKKNDAVLGSHCVESIGEGGASYQRHGKARADYGSIGKPRFEGLYVHGRADGAWSYWAISGGLLASATYRAGLLEEVRWYQDGKELLQCKWGKIEWIQTSHDGRVYAPRLEHVMKSARDGARALCAQPDPYGVQWSHWRQPTTPLLKLFLKAEERVGEPMPASDFEGP
jgi:hypothetical protein